MQYGVSTCLAPCVTSSGLSVYTGLFLRLILFCKVPHCVNSLNPKMAQAKILYFQGCNFNRLKKKGSIENKIRNCHASKFCQSWHYQNWLFFFFGLFWIQSLLLFCPWMPQQVTCSYSTCNYTLPVNQFGGLLFLGREHFISCCPRKGKHYSN